MNVQLFFDILFFVRFDDEECFLKKTTLSRPSADSTRERIIDAALSLFVKKGFAGTSISEIASLAKVNQSLIYHHFQDKQALWKNVKHSIMEQHAKLHPHKTLQELADKNLLTFLETIVTQRFYLYWKNPNPIRIINWQRVEPRAKELHKSCYASTEEWCNIIRKFQERGEIRKELSPEWVMIFITNTIAGLFMDYDALFHQKKQPITEKYISMMVSCLYEGIKSQ
jgi:AcrR family transcriptional regulator